ncbi:MAG TPA: hypothetical protein PLC88_03770 [Syntrophomonas sp.]|nr:hypothetical protein [Syntrophomonas sp.]HRW12123.1 hypothetical protein [Syntrophomonas sp.]
MNQETMKILELLEQGKITRQEAMELINSLETRSDSEGGAPVSGENTKRFLRVRVNGDKTKVNVNIPVNLIKVATQIADASMKWIPQEAHEQIKRQGINLSQIDFDEIIKLVDQGLSDGRLVDVETEDEKEGRIKVEVYVE